MLLLPLADRLGDTQVEMAQLTAESTQPHGKGHAGYDHQYTSTDDHQSDKALVAHYPSFSIFAL